MGWWFPPEVQYEFASCDYCGSIRERPILEGPDLLHRLPGIFRVVRCLECGWIRQNPRPIPSAIGYYYPRCYANFIHAIEDEPRFWRRLDRRYGMLKRRWAVERLQPRGRLLDVGCATGIFLNEMKKTGWDVTGVEPDWEAADYARHRFNIPVYAGTLRQADLPNAYFDVITMWDVLEHMHTPWQDLMEANRLLKDGGLLVIRIPNLEGVEARLFGKSWIGWDLPRHLYLFPRQALITALKQIGFHVEAISCLATSHAAFILSLQFCLENRYHRWIHWPDLIQTIGNSMLVRLLLGPFFWVLDKALLSSLITIFARKRPTRP